MQKTEAIKNYLYSALASDRLSHAYIISGGTGEERRSISSAFATSVLCESDGVMPCGRCHACRQVAANTHPDLIYVTHDKTTLGVDDVREQLCDTASIRPSQGNHKIYIVDEAEKMTQQAQNAILKTLEEPSDYVCIILLTTHEDALLETIRSRSFKISLDSDASLNKEQYEENAGILRNADAMDTETVLRTVAEIKDREEGPAGFTDFCRMWYRDVLVYKKTGDVNQLNFKEEAREIARLAEATDYKKIDDILKMIDTTADRMKANVNPELSLELLMMSLQGR